MACNGRGNIVGGTRGGFDYLDRRECLRYNFPRDAAKSTRHRREMRMSNRRTIVLALSIPLLALFGLVGESARRATQAAHSSSAATTQSTARQSDISEPALALGSAGILGTCRSNKNCTSLEYCEKPIGGCKRSGTCKARPKVCPDFFVGVCGCDGKTYPNECYAARAGVNVKFRGKCPTPRR